jgi:hypothetical protein
MQVIESDRVAFFDCDDTLIMWKPVEGVDLPEVVINGKKFWVHHKHLQKVHDYLCMGFTVFIWSNSGHKWARDVATNLGLEGKDNLYCICKPWRVFDDAKTLNDTIGHGYIPLKD